MRANLTLFNYRLGDVIRDAGGGRERRGLAAYTHLHFPHSIASEYLRRMRKNQNWNVLWNIVQERRDKFDLPTPETLVVHLRLGDVFDMHACAGNATLDVHDYLQPGVATLFPLGRKGAMRYVRPLSSFRAFPLDPRLRHAVLVGATQSGNAVRQRNPKRSNAVRRSTVLSLEYAAAIADHFSERGLVTSLRLNGLPDVDFVYMSHATSFVPSGGRYSAAVARMVRRGAGRVLVANGEADGFLSPAEVSRAREHGLLRLAFFTKLTTLATEGHECQQTGFSSGRLNYSGANL